METTTKRNVFTPTLRKTISTADGNGSICCRRTRLRPSRTATSNIHRRNISSVMSSFLINNSPVRDAIRSWQPKASCDRKKFVNTAHRLLIDAPVVDIVAVIFMC
ncbi:hypothetical protein AVEN_13964-1 [Araneus ventricosus]|uniref:Uncharacterized protein n=1 Tax=Araneus ventricosus TaxID=182803 RepID=A0A4Y2K3R2_ARAVE|nr:hypothetical protein AVEN_13964-1 [Araneus ventricosus]